MPSNYTGDPDAALADPPVFSIVSDGDKRKAASVAPTFQQLADGIANYSHYGAKTNVANTFGQQNTFGAIVTFNYSVGFQRNTRRPGWVALGNVASQTINPETDNTNFYHGLTATNPPALGAASRIVRLDTAGVFNGTWALVTFPDASVGAGVWVFRRGADNTHDICTLDSTSEPDDTAWVEFQVIGGVWRLVRWSGGVTKGTYA